jgi:hypothetical protein
VESSCEHRNEPSVSKKKIGDILEYLSDWRFLKKDSNSWGQLVNEFVCLSVYFRIGYIIETQGNNFVCSLCACSLINFAMTKYVRNKNPTPVWREKRQRYI